MTERKRKPPAALNIPFAEALRRFAQTKPTELAEELAEDVIKGRERAKKRIAEARREIEDGARPRKGRFRL